MPDVFGTESISLTRQLPIPHMLTRKNFCDWWLDSVFRSFKDTSFLISGCSLE